MSGDKLIAEAKKLDPSAIEEVVHDLEDAENYERHAERLTAQSWRG